MASNANIEIVAGDSTVITFTVTQGGSTVDISGASFWFHAKNSLNDLDANAVITKTTGSGIAFITDGTDGLGKVTLAQSDTESLVSFIHRVDLEYDIRMKDAASNVTTVTKGLLLVLPRVTRTVP